jgi:small subunit ribosomal protein S6
MENFRQYESTYLVRPDLSEADFKQIVDKFNKVLAAGNAQIINQEIWGLQKLAYQIERFTSAYYVFTEFKAPAELIRKLEREYGFDERVIRNLTVVMDKDGIAYADRRRNKRKHTAEVVA